MPIRLMVLISLGLLTSMAWARPAGFFLERLPKGADVTLPRPAVTFVKLTDRVTLSSTDIPQTIKFQAVKFSKGKPKSFKVAIYDDKARRVRYVRLKPGIPYLYSFKELGSIAVVPETPQLKRGQKLKHYGLRVESNKPLGLSR